MKRVSIVLFIAPLIVLGLLYATDSAPEVGAAVLIFWMFVSIPVAIVVVIDWYREATPKGPVQRALRHLLKVPLFLFGVIGWLIGMSIALWVAYNLLWERQPQFRGVSSPALLVGMLALGWYLIRMVVKSESDGAQSQGDIEDEDDH